jgi:hypothetical protein
VPAQSNRIGAGGVSDSVHRCLGITPQHSVANTVGNVNVLGAIPIHQKYGRKKNFVGLDFWVQFFDRYLKSMVEEEL